MIKTIEIYCLLFLTYAFLGWCMEVTAKLLQTGKFVNRGFLIGPYCPIYGWGAICITLLLKRYLDDPIVLFVMSTLICSIIEYFTSYFMEKKYHARWWDYSNKKFNINGRICLETLIPFGILGVIIMYLTNPFFMNLYDKLPDIALHVLAGGLILCYLVDNFISAHIVATIKIEGTNAEKDNTKEITERVKQILREKSILHRRLINAFPNMKDIQGIRQKLRKRENDENKNNNL